MIQHSPAAERNKEPILNVLRKILPLEGTILEVASGSGQHITYLAEAFPTLTWLPSDISHLARASIDALAVAKNLENLRPAIPIDAQAFDWPIRDVAGIININMIHISPWAACEGLFRNAEKYQTPWVYLYGPMILDNHPTAPSNLSFDLSLRQQNPEWGIRNLPAVQTIAETFNFAVDTVISMPANNLSVVFRAKTSKN